MPSCFFGIREMNKNIVKISKYLSFVLRHKPEEIGVELDENGWLSIDELIDKTKKYTLTYGLILEVVETNDKKRFAISGDGTKIKANQGHSVDIDLGLTPVNPPDCLYHGTAQRNLGKILVEGLLKMDRHHVHLSESVETAHKVGTRYGKPVILKVDTALMLKRGFIFYVTENNVWLAESVPAEAISIKID